MRCACRLRKQRASSVSFTTPDPLLRRRPADSSRGALGSSNFGFRQARWAFKFAGILRHLTIRSSRPHVVVLGTRFCTAISSSRLPTKGLPNPGVRRQKSLSLLCFQMLISSASVGAALRSGCRRAASSVKPVWRAHISHALRWPASETAIGTVILPRLTRSLRRHPAESSRMRARAFPLRLSASAPGCDLHRHPPPPNNSFKPTPCRGTGRVLYAPLAHVRRPATGRLNSSVRPHEKISDSPSVTNLLSFSCTS